MFVKNVWKCAMLGCFTFAGLGQAAWAEDANMEKAMTAAFGSKEIKKLKVKGHEFNVKPIKSENKSGGFVKVSGQISHHRSVQRDDQVQYSFTMRPDGKVEDIDVSVDKSALLQMREILNGDFIDEIRNELERLGESPIADLNSLEDAIKLADRNIGGGGWERAAAGIIANVMIRSKTSTSARGVRVYDRVSHLRRTVERAGYRPAARGKPVDRPTGVGGVTATGGGYSPAVKVRDQRKR